MMLKDVMKGTAAVFNRVRERYGLPPVYNLIDFVKSDLTLLPELSGLPWDELPGGYRYTDPIFAKMDLPVPEGVKKVYSRKGLRIFCSLGSSGSPEIFRTIAETLRGIIDINTVCVTTTIMEPEELGPISDNFFAARYLPPHLVNEMADIAVTHGGQGTIQTSVWAGTPVGGIGFQAEQQANIDGLVWAGMGLRIPLYSVVGPKLLKAIEKVRKRGFKESALKMQELVRKSDGVTESVRRMNELVMTKHQ